MSLLVDPPLLVACGAAVNAFADERTRRLAQRVIVATFLGTSVSLYCNARWTRRLWELCGATSGRDWMINSGVTRFDHADPPAAVHALAAALFTLYPLWFQLGRRITVRIER